MYRKEKTFLPFWAMRCKGCDDTDRGGLLRNWWAKDEGLLLQKLYPGIWFLTNLGSSDVDIDL